MSAAREMTSNELLRISGLLRGKGLDRDAEKLTDIAALIRRTPESSLAEVPDPAPVQPQAWEHAYFVYPNVIVDALNSGWEFAAPPLIYIAGDGESPGIHRLISDAVAFLRRPRQEEAAPPESELVALRERAKWDAEEIALLRCRIVAVADLHHQLQSEVDRYPNSTEDDLATMKVIAKDLSAALLLKPVQIGGAE